MIRNGLADLMLWQRGLCLMGGVPKVKPCKGLLRQTSRLPRTWQGCSQADSPE